MLKGVGRSCSGEKAIQKVPQRLIDFPQSNQTVKFRYEGHQNSNGFGGLLSLPNKRGKVKYSSGFSVLLAINPSGCVAGQSECYQKVRQYLSGIRQMANNDNPLQAQSRMK